MDGYCGSGGDLPHGGTYGYRWSDSPEDYDHARGFKFNEDKGGLSRYYRRNALPVRPVFK